MGLEGKYASWPSLYSKVLKPALEQINQKSPLRAHLSTKKLGREVKSVLLEVARKENK